MVRLRLQRLGRRHRPFYRLAAMDSRTRRNGAVIERLGWFDPMAPEGKANLELKGERIRHWLDVGAQPSDTVRDLLAKNDVLNDKEKAAWEADREVARNRVVAAKAVERATKAVEAVAALSGESEADLSSFEQQARDASKAAAAAKSAGKVAEADAAAGQAEAAVEAAKKADEEAKAKAAAKAAEEAKAAEAAKAAEEAAAAEEKPAEEG